MTLDDLASDPNLQDYHILVMQAVTFGDVREAVSAFWRAVGYAYGAGQEDEAKNWKRTLDVTFNEVIDEASAD